MIGALIYCGHCQWVIFDRHWCPVASALLGASVTFVIEEDAP